MTSPTTFFIAIQYAAKPDEFPIINETHLGGRHHSTTFENFVKVIDWDEPPIACLKIEKALTGFKATDVTKDVAEYLAEQSFGFRFYARPEWIEFYKEQGVTDYFKPDGYEPWKSETLGGSALI